MSFSFYLYRAANGLPPINRWSGIYAEPLGDLTHVADLLSELFGGLAWDKRQQSWNGQKPDCVSERIDIWLHPAEDGFVHFIVMNNAPPSAMRMVCEALQLNYVAAPEADDLVDIYGYDDNDRYYSKKSWKR